MPRASDRPVPDRADSLWPNRGERCSGHLERAPTLPPFRPDEEGSRCVKKSGGGRVGEGLYPHLRLCCNTSFHVVRGQSHVPARSSKGGSGNPGAVHARISARLTLSALSQFVCHAQILDLQRLLMNRPSADSPFPATSTGSIGAGRDGREDAEDQPATPTTQPPASLSLRLRSAAPCSRHHLPPQLKARLNHASIARVSSSRPLPCPRGRCRQP